MNNNIYDNFRLSQKYKMWMHKALFYANHSLLNSTKNQDVPVGCILVNINDEKIISHAYNSQRCLGSPIAHAEINVIQKLINRLNAERRSFQYISQVLRNSILIVTLEPCLMCAGAILLSKIPKIIIGARSNKTKNIGSIFEMFKRYPFNYKIEIFSGILESRCSAKVRHFFHLRRTSRLKYSGKNLKLT